MIKVKTNPMKYKDSNGNMIDVGGVIGKEVTDLTLTKSNVPADSKTVGDKLNKLSEEKVDQADAVLVIPQTLTDDQKAQARTNIGAASEADKITFSYDAENKIVRFLRAGGTLLELPAEKVVEYYKLLTDTDLTEAGVPADAAAVGERFGELSQEKVDKNWGASNVGKILVVGTDGNLVLTDMPEASGDVTGVLDESMNILLSGNLADGTYPLKWLLDDGTYADAGSLTVAAIPEPPSYTNLATTFATGRLKSGGKIDTATTAATVCLDYIPFVQGTVVRVKGFGALTDYNCAMYIAEPTSDMIGVVTDSVPSCYSSSKANETASVYSYSYDSASGIVTLTSLLPKAKVLRVSGILTGTTEDVIITVNEDIA